jgi:TonB-linked SusC/RagA family outer membrane protein
MTKSRWLFAILFAVAVLPISAAAQQAATVTGRVTNAQGQPEAAVLVRIEALGVGVPTDPDGSYRLVVPGTRLDGPRTVQITASRQGLAMSSATITLQPGATVTRDFTMSPSAILLEGLVVSAMGIERERSQLGTAQQQISSEELNTTRAMSVVNQLQGKVSGLQITGGGVQGGSNHLVIRGANSIAGNNQPLFIIDGIPASNLNRAAGAAQGRGLLISGWDYGNAISDLNPEDIATVTVLKGPNAAAIYGSRAANGAIVITTKRGEGAAAAGGIQTEITTTMTRERPSILPTFQNRYGQGAEGNYYVTADQSWGPRMDGQPICQGVGSGCIVRPFSPQPNNVHDFFETGTSLATTVSFAGGSDRANARLSLGYDHVDGYVPNNTFDKYTVNLNAGVKVTDRLNATGSAQYFRNNGLNRPGSGYLGSIMQQFFWFGRQVDINDLRNYSRGGAHNGGPITREYNWNYNYHNNPYWIQYENPVEDRRDRLMLSATATYALADGIAATLRSGSDIFSFNAEQRYAPGNLTYTNQNFHGGFAFIDDYSNEHNSELLLTADRHLTSRVRLNGLAGAGIRREYLLSESLATPGLLVPGLYHPSNAAVAPTPGRALSERHVNSGFGSLSLTWDEWLTVEGTARNDWSSTLPAGENSYFYPSISTSLVLTEALPGLRSDVLSFVKLRGSIAKVGSDAPPYQLVTTFTGLPQQFMGQSQFTQGDVLANAQLKPEITRSNEVGLELEFLHGRAIIDATYYAKSTRDQIFNVPISPTSGFASRSINAGLVANNGFEGLVTLVPVDLASGFRWTTTFNMARNRSEVKELYPGVETVLLGNGIFADSRLESRVGRPMGAIFSNVFARDEATGKLLTDGGLPFAAPGGMQYIGTVQPDWTGGWHNELSYRGVSFAFLLDIKQGGSLVSYTNMVGSYSGVLESSLRGREVNWNDPGLIVDGIDVNTGQPNTIVVTAEEYAQGHFGIMEPYIYDASYTKLREVRLGFDLPSRMVSRLNARSINIGLTGRNLMTWTDVPNIDPEFAYSSGNFQGIEYAIPANPRSIGLSVRIRP